MKRVETIGRPGEVEFFLRLLGLWEALISLPPPPEPLKHSSPSNLPGRPFVPGFRRTMTRPQPTRLNFGTKPPAQVGKPRKSISETDALSSWNTPDARRPPLSPFPVPPMTPPAKSKFLSEKTRFQRTGSGFFVSAVKLTSSGGGTRRSQTRQGRWPWSVQRVRAPRSRHKGSQRRPGCQPRRPPCMRRRSDNYQNQEG